MKKLMKGIGILAAVLALVLLVVSVFLGTAIEKGIPVVGPKVAGVPMSAGNVKLNAFTGKATVTDLVIGNPPGFKSAQAFKLGKFDFDMSIPSLLSGRVLIRRILIDAPEITYELGARGSNLGALQKGMEKPAEEKQPEPEAPEEPKASGGEGKKVEITELVISNGKITFAASGLGGRGAPLPLPTLTLRDIGKDTGGASLGEVFKEIMKAIETGSTSAVTTSGKLLGESAKDLGKGMESAGKKLGEAVGEGGSQLGDVGRKLGSESKKTLGDVGGLLKRGGNK